ncbi:glycosyltransferase family 2 protein [Humisphaera borealis]|uniref:Glycosyltransferase n=1 Tax=Humisphaera borealis TaxID=2807512 RepID=A0A7M2WVM8_9BACT|nr:glycosyltransferase [Humisphaera borealis]QOV89439.1 glycosyltransferase [Humisphaera borealis]
MSLSPPGSPVVSVIIAVHNEERFVGDAIDSILSQTLSPLELIVIDDASSDATPVILQRIADTRIQVVRNEVNLGLTASLNRGLAAARGAFVARLDGDDIARPDRLALQVDFLERHPDVGIVGSSRRVVDEQGTFLYEATAIPDDAAIRWRLLLGNPLAHPTVMIRRSVLDKHELRYDESFRTAQDYELWTRLAAVTKTANLVEPLVTYRRRQTGISVSRRDEQLATHDRIAGLAFERLLPGFEISTEEVRQLRGRYGGQSVREPEMDPAEPKWQELLEAVRREFDRQSRSFL